MHASSFHPKKTNGLAECATTQLDLFDYRVSDHTAAARLLCSHHAPKARCMMQIRQAKGLQIAHIAKISHIENLWLVPSQSSSKKYAVDLDQDSPTCTCPDFKKHGQKCKHIHAAEFALQQESGVQLPEPPPQRRPTYSQEWPADNLAQTHEKSQFLALLY